MDSINITNARQELFSLAEKTIETSRPVKITSKKGSLVLISEADYNALQETLYLLSIPGLRDDIAQGRQEKPEDCALLEDIGWDIH